MKSLSPVESFLNVIEIINDWIGRITSYLILPFIFMITYEVVRRYLFNSPSIWVEESVLLAFGVYLMLGGAYTSYHKMHVNVDVFYRRWSVKTKAIMDLVTFPIFLLFIIILLWKGGDMAWTSVQRLERSHTVWRPIIYPVKLMVPAGAFLVLLQGLVKFIRDLSIAITGRNNREY